MRRLWQTLFASVVLVSGWARGEPLSYVLTQQGQAQLSFTVEAPLDTIVGVSQGVVGAAHLDLSSGASSARLIADLSAFRTGIELRDQDLRDQFFEVGQF